MTGFEPGMFYVAGIEKMECDRAPKIIRFRG
jgi:hypothetical protein